MIDIGTINKTFEKLWLPKICDFVLCKRFCRKHMREFIKKNKSKIKNEADLNVVQLLGICSKCKKAGIVYYIEGNIEKIGKRLKKQLYEAK